MQKVFVLDTNKKPLAPCRPKRARILLRENKAAIFRRFPFTIILKVAYREAQPNEIQIKIDPGNITTGMALVTEKTKEIVYAAEITHRGKIIRKKLEKRKNIRKNRRNRKLRYRKPRFLNRKKSKEKLSPSLESRVCNIITYVRPFMKFAPISGISYEIVSFDTQKMQNSDIANLEYTQGKLQGYEIKQYLLEKYNHTCIYCGKENIPLEIEHIIPKSRGGTNRVSNLTIACRSCNIKKGNKTATEFGFPNVQNNIRKSLKDAGIMNSIKNIIYNRLEKLNIPIELGYGYETKYNRIQQNYPKKHWIDAACVGKSGEKVTLDANLQPLSIIAQGYGNRQMCLVNKYGFPRTSPKCAKKLKDFKRAT